MILYEDKTIDTTHCRYMCHYSLFLDLLHMEKYFYTKLGNKITIGVHMYDPTYYTPSREAVDIWKAAYGVEHSTYLNSFKYSEIYHAYSQLNDMMTISKRASIQMSAALRNHLRAVERNRYFGRFIKISYGFPNKTGSSPTICRARPART